MSEQMDFGDGKYTVIYDNGSLKALRYGEPWKRDLTGDNLIYWMLVEAIRLKEERDALAAKLKELEGQEPITVEWPTYPYESMVSGLEERGVAGHYDAMLYGWERGVKQVVGALPDSLFYARPVPAEPVNARLLEAAKAALDAMTCSGEADDPGHRCGHCDDYVDRNGVVRAALRDALAAAESQQVEPVRLTRESVARAIWGVRREYEDRCDMELEGMGESHPVWDEADAVLAAAELTQTDPTWLTIEQERNAERYAYLRSQHEGSVAASFAVFAPEQPIGEFGPVGSMPGELDAAIDSAMRADSHKVEG